MSRKDDTTVRPPTKLGSLGNLDATRVLLQQFDKMLLIEALEGLTSEERIGEIIAILPSDETILAHNLTTFDIIARVIVEYPIDNVTTPALVKAYTKRYDAVMGQTMMVTSQESDITAGQETVGT